MDGISRNSSKPDASLLLELLRRFFCLQVVTFSAISNPESQSKGKSML